MVVGPSPDLGMLNTNSLPQICPQQQTVRGKRGTWLLTRDEPQTLYLTGISLTGSLTQLREVIIPGLCLSLPNKGSERWPNVFNKYMSRYIIY